MEQREKLQLVIEQLEERIAPGVVHKGNNGWGNGAEGINSGSDDGGTASSKFSESAVDGGPNGGTPNSTTR
jgi:hypothetical protein